MPAPLAVIARLLIRQQTTANDYSRLQTFVQRLSLDKDCIFVAETQKQCNMEAKQLNDAIGHKKKPKAVNPTYLLADLPSTLFDGSKIQHFFEPARGWGKFYCNELSLVVCFTRITVNVPRIVINCFLGYCIRMRMAPAAVSC
jgi:hypothetical protein